VGDESTWKKKVGGLAGMQNQKMKPGLWSEEETGESRKGEKTVTYEH